MSISVDGKWAERQAKDWLDQKSGGEAGFAWHRYPDARAARGALAAQPADYLIARKRDGEIEPCHLEVKETKEVNRLPKKSIGQYGKLKMFSMAGFRTLVLIYRSTTKDWVYLEDDHLFSSDECPPSFLIGQHRPRFQTAAAALDYAFS